MHLELINFKLKPLAKIDLENIWNYSTFHWGEKQANKYQDDFFSSFLKICENPDAGKEKAEIKKNYRFLKSNQHFICYKINGNIIEIIRILHEKMNFEKHLG